jgi:transposase
MGFPPDDLPIGRQTTRAVVLINPNTPVKIAAKRRFLDAYRETLRIAVAARTAGVHRATVYRWLEDPAFVEAKRLVTEDFFRLTRARALEQEEARCRWRQERERARRPMRCEVLAKARAAKRR